MTDLGSSISLVRGNFITSPKLDVPIQQRDVKVDHSFVLVQSLITPVTLGIDFMQKHGLVLDFTTTPITISIQTIHVNCQPDHDLEPLLSAMRKVKLKVAAIPSMSQSIEDDCEILIFYALPSYELPKCSDPILLSLVDSLTTFQHFSGQDYSC